MKIFTVLTLCFGGFVLVGGTIQICIPLPFANVKSEGQGQKVALEQTDNDGSVCPDHLDLNIVHPALTMNGTVDNVCIHNLLDYNMTLYVGGNCISSACDFLNLTFSRVRIEGIYNISGEIGALFDYSGAGNFWLELIDFSVAMNNLLFNITEEICFPVNLDLHIGAMRNNFENLMNDAELGDLMNRAISNIGPEAIEIVWSELKDIYDEPLEEAIHDLFHKEKVYDSLNKLYMSTITSVNDGKPLYSSKINNTS